MAVLAVLTDGISLIPALITLNFVSGVFPRPVDLDRANEHDSTVTVEMTSQLLAICDKLIARRLFDPDIATDIEGSGVINDNHIVVPFFVIVSEVIEDFRVRVELLAIYGARNQDTILETFGDNSHILDMLSG